MRSLGSCFFSRAQFGAPWWETRGSPSGMRTPARTTAHAHYREPTAQCAPPLRLRLVHCDCDIAASKWQFSLRFRNARVSGQATASQNGTSIKEFQETQTRPAGLSTKFGTANFLEERHQLLEDFSQNSRDGAQSDLRPVRTFPDLKHQFLVKFCTESTAHPHRKKNCHHPSLSTASWTKPLNNRKIRLGMVTQARHTCSRVKKFLAV